MGFPKTNADIASVKCIAAIMVRELKIHTESPFFVKVIPLDKPMVPSREYIVS